MLVNENAQHLTALSFTAFVYGGKEGAEGGNAHKSYPSVRAGEVAFDSEGIMSMLQMKTVRDLHKEGMTYKNCPWCGRDGAVGLSFQPSSLVIAALTNGYTQVNVNRSNMAIGFQIVDILQRIYAVSRQLDSPMAESPEGGSPAKLLPIVLMSLPSDSTCDPLLRYLANENHLIHINIPYSPWGVALWQRIAARRTPSINRCKVYTRRLQSTRTVVDVMLTGATVRSVAPRTATENNGVLVCIWQIESFGWLAAAGGTSEGSRVWYGGACSYERALRARSGSTHLHLKHRRGVEALRTQIDKLKREHVQ
ncbi:hypothetical protein BU15DRAFT_68813 [Melanogaster broomeanus]|nr:hypothetical protein BU15DRAFT_68813 [Melanogaster broomeanus]